MKKYVVWPGWVTSQWDGERHWINARKLMVLYGVHPDECYIADELPPEFNIANLIQLRPLSNGKYEDLGKTSGRGK